MTASPKSLRSAVIVGIIVLGLLPVILYWLVIGRMHTITTPEAKAALARDPARAVLVDVREPDEFAAEHLQGAVNWPLSKIKVAAHLPPELSGKSLYLICASGIRSALAARALKQWADTDYFNVRGGMQEWKNDVNQPCPLRFCRLVGPRGSSALPQRAEPLWVQWTLSVMGFGIKPFYMLLSLALVAVLWRSTAPDLTALRWGLIFFFAGEAFCAANYIIFRDLGYTVEYLHSYGMVLAFAFTGWAALTGLDHRAVRFSDPARKCAALDLCGACIKHADVPCGLRRVFILILPMFMVLAVLPLMADFIHTAYNTFILGTPYNYSHEVIFQIYELRFGPVMALIFFAAALIAWWPRRTSSLPWAKALFAAGLGFFGFAYFRLFLVQSFANNLVWFSNWEEIMELLFIVGTAAVLWIFRGRLLAEHPEPA